MKRRAFTLIELLMVVSIISLLVGILLPALSRSRQLGRSTQCLANLHSLGTAVLMYADTNDGRLPNVGLAHGGAVDEGNAWINAAATDIGNEKVTRCPDDRSPYWDTPVGATTQLRRLSYATNYFTTGLIEGREDCNMLTRIKRPSTTIMWGELAEKGDYAAADHYHPETWFANPSVLAAQQLTLDRHLARANWGFLDAHAETLRFEDTYAINVAASSFPNIAWIHNRFDPQVAW